MTTAEEALAAIEAAFRDQERPSDADLLHPRCFDDMDLEGLYPISHWTEMTDADVVGCYASLSFLSAAGFRHFLPAYMRFVLRNPESAEAVVSSTIWALDPTIHEGDLADFARSKYELLADAQRRAVVAFLRAMAQFDPDAGRALRSWQG